MSRMSSGLTYKDGMGDAGRKHTQHEQNTGVLKPCISSVSRAALLCDLVVASHVWLWNT